MARLGVRQMKYEFEFDTVHEVEVRGYLTYMVTFLAKQASNFDRCIDECGPNDSLMVAALDHKARACQFTANLIQATLAETREDFARREAPKVAQTYGERFGRKGRK